MQCEYCIITHDTNNIFLGNQLEQATSEGERHTLELYRLIGMKTSISQGFPAKEHETAQYPLMVVHYPQCMKMPHIAWIETLNNKPVETLINYPTRQTIIKWTSGREPAV